MSPPVCHPRASSYGTNRGIGSPGAPGGVAEWFRQGPAKPRTAVPHRTYRCRSEVGFLDPEIHKDPWHATPVPLSPLLDRDHGSFVRLCQLGQCISEHLISVTRGVLVEQGCTWAGMPHPHHQLRSACTRSCCPGVRGVPQIVEVQCWDSGLLPCGIPVLVKDVMP